MALLQNDKAIFYHPCDNSTESLKSQAWTESTAEYVSGKITNGLAGGPGSVVSYGTAIEFNSANTRRPKVVKLSSTVAVVAYRQGAGSSRPAARVLTISGTDVTAGPEYEADAGGSYAVNVNAEPVDSTTFVIIYHDTNAPTARVGKVSGTDITYGNEQLFGVGADAGEYSWGANLGSGKIALSFYYGSQDRIGVRICTVSGTDLTIGAWVSADATGTPHYNQLRPLSSTKLLLLWYDDAQVDASRCKSKIGTVSGTDTTWGPTVLFNDSAITIGSYGFAVEALSSTSFIVAYADSADSGIGKLKVGTVSGTDITYGAEIGFADGGATGAGISVSSLSSTRFVIARVTGNAARVGIVSGTDVTFGAEESFTDPSQMYIAALDSTTFVVTGRDATTNNGNAEVGSLGGGGATLTASTPGAYDSAAATTKVAFAAWLKNPSA